MTLCPSSSFVRVFLSFSIVVLLAVSTFGQGFPPGVGGGGGGGGNQGNGTFESDDIEIISITASGQIATITWKLHDDYTGSGSPLLSTQDIDNDVIDTQSISSETAKDTNYTKTIDLGASTGTFSIYLSYPSVGTGHKVSVDNNTVTILQSYVAFLGINRLNHLPSGDFFSSLDTTTMRGTPESANMVVINDTMVRVPLFPIYGQGHGVDVDGSLPFVLQGQFQNSYVNGIAGPGFYAAYHMPVFLASDEDGTDIGIRIYVPSMAKWITLRDSHDSSLEGTGTSQGINSDAPIDGNLEGKYKIFKSAKLLNSGGNLETDLADVATIEITKLDGTLLKFELWDIENSGGDNDQDFDSYARLTKITNRNGVDLVTCTYASSTTGVPATVTDQYGHSASFTYGATVAGEPALTAVTFNGQTTNLSYANDFLNEITYPNGAKWTCTLAHDSGSQTHNLTIDSPFQGTLIWRLTEDFFLGRDANDNVVYNQAARVFRSVSDANDDLIKGIYFNPSDNSEARIWTTGDRLALYKSNINERYIRYYETWTLGDITQGWNAFSNLTLETEYQKMVYPANGGTESDVAHGAAATIGTGYYTSIDCKYNDDRYQTERTYSDDTYESWSYDAYGNVTRHRDRDTNVTLYVYDSNGNLTTVKVGIKDTGTKTSPNDVNQSEYTEYKFDYDSSGRLTTAYAPNWTNEADVYRTDYTYYTSGQLKEIIQGADSTGGTRPKTTLTYNSWGKVATVTDPVGDVTTYTYDTLGRRTKVTYPDSTFSEILFAGTGSEGMPERQRATDGSVVKIFYDSVGRVNKVINGYSTINSSGSETVNTDVLTQSVTEYFYDGNSGNLSHTISNGKKVEYDYDYKFRPTETRAFPNTGTTLTSKTVYDGDRVFYEEDPFGRRTYYGYDLTQTFNLNGTKIRTVAFLIPGQTLADNSAVLNQTRDLTNNATFTIVDYIRDYDNHKVQTIDQRGITSERLFDSRGRVFRSIAAVGTSDETKSEIDYDSASNVSEVRMPRYFDSSDTNGYNLSKMTFGYNGRNIRTTTNSAPGTAIASTQTVAYNLDGTTNKVTDGRGFDWEVFWNFGTVQGSKDPAGHGAIVNTDDADRTTHRAIVSDYSSHTNKHDPTNSKTLAETTARYDILGRPIASTAWLNARGTIDPNDAPIAGLDGIAKTEGSTSQIIYDTNLADGVGLDNATGVTVNKLGGGTYNISLSTCLTKLTDTNANGGANISFTNNISSGAAAVSINAEEELSVTIVDALGRTVMVAQIEPYFGTTPNALISWACASYDHTVTVTGFGTCTEIHSIDAAGKIAKSRMDAAGRILEVIDEESNVSTAQYDASGNIVKARDANGVGFDAVYNNLDQLTSQTDTWGSQVQYAYNANGRIEKMTDAKSKFTTVTYDTIGRRLSVSDRMSLVTSFTYDKNNNLLSVTDAESKTTSYQYNNRNLRDQITYPDHVSGSTQGNTGYGIVEVAYDAMGRPERHTDQLGDTVTFNYDLLGRMHQRDYRTKANSPSGTIADSDTFTFDAMGRVLTAEKGRYNNEITLVYDIAGRLKSESLDISGKTYTTTRQYNSLGQLTKLTYPSGKIVERSYTDRGRLYQVKYDSNVVDTRTYDVGNRLSSVTYGNSLVTNISYRTSGSNKDNLISQVACTGVGTYAYSYDANKNKTKETITGNPITGYSFDTTVGTDPDGYDDNDRLTYWKRSDNNKTQSWTLSAVADWTSFTENGTATSRTHGNTHEVTSIGSSSLTYDLKGNLTGDTIRGNTYEWDFDNQMSSVDTNGDSTPDVQFEYDAFGRRVKKGSTVFAYSDFQSIVEYTSGSEPASPNEQFVYGSYVDEPILKDGTGGILYYHRNKQYSITALSNSSGSVVERYVYSAFGELQIFDGAGATRTSTNYNNHYTFTGRRFDSETEIYYFRARYYDADQGRFVGRDPMGYIDGMSMYRGYFAPQSVDPLGLYQNPDDKKKVKDGFLPPPKHSNGSYIPNVNRPFVDDRGRMFTGTNQYGHGVFVPGHWPKGPNGAFITPFLDPPKKQNTAPQNTLGPIKMHKNPESEKGGSKTGSKNITSKPGGAFGIDGRTQDLAGDIDQFAKDTAATANDIGEWTPGLGPILMGHNAVFGKTVDGRSAGGTGSRIWNGFGAGLAMVPVVAPSEKLIKGTGKLLRRRRSIGNGTKNAPKGLLNGLETFKFKGAVRNDGLRNATHADIMKAFKGTQFTPTNHFIKRLKDVRTDALGIKRFKDIETIFRKGSVLDADDGMVAIAHNGMAIIVNPKTGRLVTLTPWK